MHFLYTECFDQHVRIISKFSINNFFSLHELTVSFTMHTFLISNFISLQLELGHPVQNHRPDIDQQMPESDSEILDGDQISSDSDSLYSEVNFSSEEDVEVLPLPSDDEDEVQPVPLDNSSLEVEDTQSKYICQYNMCQTHTRMHEYMHINVIYEPALICISILLYKYL